jgi:hypothetical protein
MRIRLTQGALTAILIGSTVLTTTVVTADSALAGQAKGRPSVQKAQRHHDLVQHEGHWLTREQLHVLPEARATQIRGRRLSSEEVRRIETSPEDEEGFRVINGLEDAISLVMSIPPPEGKVLTLHAFSAVDGQRQEILFALTTGDDGGIKLETGLARPQGFDRVVVAGWPGGDVDGHESIDLSKWQGWRYQYIHVGGQQ